MCGIVGQVKEDGGPADATLLGTMCAALEHRGPDSRGVHTDDDGGGLGIQRLRIIDLETGDQPIYNEDRSVVVVLNGEIYNYRELRERLVRSGHTFQTHGDTEPIVHLYEEEGVDCVRHLHGMFAFALWDRRKRQLLVARDRVGKKPLFYSHRNGTLTFASELRALMQDPQIPRDVDHQAIDCYLTYQYVPAPLSAFRAVRKLPPASTLTYRDGEVAIERYWRLDYGRKRKVDSREELNEEIRDTIRRATKRRMVSDVPLGAFLSGGIDSSAVVGAMAESSSQPVKTFSIGFENAAFNELEYARMIAEQFGTDHHEFVVRPDAVDRIPQIVRQYGEPFADSSAIACFHLAELTRGHVTVALAGDGGDEDFAGYDRYVDVARAGDRRALRAYSGLLAWDYFDEAARAELYEADFLEQIGTGSVLDIIGDPYAVSDAPDVVGRILDVDTQTYLSSDLLVKMDIASMAHSLEVRSPLLDHVLMEAAAAIPSEAKLDGTTKKRIYKDALRPWLPDRLLDRPKMGFAVPLVEWFRGPLRDLPREILLDRRALGRGLFREAAVRKLLDDHVAGGADNANRIWTLIQLELWFQTYVDAAPVAAPIASAA
jgi:asparagine synthase (glutamine-hydrolysing)